MFGFSRDEGGSSLLSTTIKSALVVAALSCVAVGWLASVPLESPGFGRLALGTGRTLDPLTTGSIADRASGARLDPCAMPLRR